MPYARHHAADRPSAAPTRKIAAATIAAVLAIVARLLGLDLGPNELNVIVAALAPVITGYLVRGGPITR